MARVEKLRARRDFASLVSDMDAFPELEELQQAGCQAVCDIIQHGGSREEAILAGAVECVVRALDLFQHSAETQLTSLIGLSVLINADSSKAGICIACNAGAVPLLVRVLRSFPDNAPLLGHAFLLLSRFVPVQRYCGEALRCGAVELCVTAVRRCATFPILQEGAVLGPAFVCLAQLCLPNKAVAADANSMGAMELALAALNKHRSNANVTFGAGECLRVLCFGEICAVRAKQLGAPALLQAVLKAHPFHYEVRLLRQATTSASQAFPLVFQADARCRRW